MAGGLGGMEGVWDKLVERRALKWKLGTGGGGGGEGRGGSQGASFPKIRLSMVIDLIWGMNPPLTNAPRRWGWKAKGTVKALRRLFEARRERDLETEERPREKTSAWLLTIWLIHDF